VLNGLDNLDARRHVNRLCVAAGTPLIESGTAGHKGQVRVVWLCCFAFCFLLSAFCFLLPASCFLLCFLLPASCFLLPASCFLLPASCFLLPASCFLLSAFCFLLITFCFLLLACIAPVPSGFEVD